MNNELGGMYKETVVVDANITFQRLIFFVPYWLFELQACETKCNTMCGRFVTTLEVSFTAQHVSVRSAPSSETQFSSRKSSQRLLCTAEETRTSRIVSVG